MNPLALILFVFPSPLCPVQEPPIQELLKKAPQHEILFRRAGPGMP